MGVSLMPSCPIARARALFTLSASTINYGIVRRGCQLASQSKCLAQDNKTSRDTSAAVFPGEPMPRRIFGTRSRNGPRSFSEEIAECNLQARECREKAKLANDRRRREFFLELEHRWLVLVRLLALTARLSDFRNEVPQNPKK